MSNRLSKVFVIALVTAIMLNAAPMIVPAIKASTPPPPAFWVVPDTVTFNANSTPVGTLFNVTVWASVTIPTTAWNMKLGFDPTMLHVVVINYTAFPTSQFFSGHATTPGIPSVIDNTAGFVLWAESLAGISDTVGPASGSLVYITFQIIAAPAPGTSFTCHIDPGFGVPTDDTYFLDIDTNEEPGLSTAYCTYTYVGTTPAAKQPPVAVFDYSPKPVVVGQLVTFDGSASYDPDGVVVAWNWDFGDASTASGKVVTHAYSSAGTVVVNLTVTDNDGLSNSLTKQFIVYQSQPAHIYVDPAPIIDLSLGPMSTFYVNITLTAVASIGVVQFNLTYDPLILNWIGIELLPVPQYPTATLTVTSGSLGVNLNYINVTLTGVPAPLVRLRFGVNSYGITPLSLMNINLLDSHGNAMPFIESDGLFANIIRDVAVTNVVPARSWVYQGWIENINVTVANLGNVSESFTVSALCDGTLIGTAPVSGLAPNAQATVDIAWNTTGVLAGNYTITGNASLVPYENYFNTANNVYVDGVVRVLNVIHDVAITDVSPSVSWAYAGSTVPIDVTAANLGNVSESFSVTTNYDGNAIGTLPVTNLMSNSSTVLTFNWDTTGIAEGNYTISAQASIIPFEYNTTNNYLTDGQVLVLTAIRDVAITNVTTSANAWVYQGRPVNVTVTAANIGQVTESFYVTAYYDANLIGNISVINLAPNASIVEVFTWNTSGVTPLYHNFTISAQASAVPFEFNTANNVFIDDVVLLRCLGDVNGDGKVDIKDILVVAQAFGSYGPNVQYPGSPPSSRWNPAYDLTGPVYLVPDGKVDIRDIALVARNFGHAC